MEKEIAVTNSSSLIFLAKLNIFHLAKKMFKEIYIPSQVINELIIKKGPENMAIEKEMNGFLKRVEISKIKEMPIEEGEKSGISYCLENNIQTFLSDDKKARIVAESLGLKAKGILGILIWNLKHKNINKEECESLIEKLIGLGYYISSELHSEIIKLIRNL